MQALLHSALFFYGVTFVTVVISASTGMGTSMILLPIAAIRFGAKEAVGIMTIFFIFQNINKCIAFWKHIDWSLAWKVVTWSIPGVVIGSIALVYIPTELFTKLFALCILFYLANEIFKIIPSRAASHGWIAPAGFFYGFLSGMIGTGNMIKGPLFISMGLRKHTYVGTCAVTSFFMNIPKIISYSTTGIITEHSFVLALPFLAVSIAGTWIGKQFLHKIPHDVFYWILMTSFAISAIVLLFD